VTRTDPARGGAARPFLTARWEHLIILNYVVPEELLRPLVPAGTELDRWQGDALVSLVGFHFRDTRVRGLAIPGHRHFEEVNLRFYVLGGAERRRGVVFIREIVPRLAVAWIARWTYNEPYLAAPMSNEIDCGADCGGTIRYRWRHRRQPFVIEATMQGAAAPMEEGSESQFVAEHYWGYTRQRDGRTLEYRVDHPSWLVWSPESARFEGDAVRLYGESFGEILSRPPRSATVALGSEVAVHAGVRIA
jgi:uncharacterized protein YqjF (DUF2071 family)